jgi:hypothetical protein
MKITDPHIVIKDRYPQLHATIDGINTIVPNEQKFRDRGLIFIGGDFEDTHRAELPADPEDGRPNTETLYGFTDDATVLALYNHYSKMLFSGDVVVGPVSISNI